MFWTRGHDSQHILGKLHDNMVQWFKIAVTTAKISCCKESQPLQSYKLENDNKLARSSDLQANSKLILGERLVQARHQSGSVNTNCRYQSEVQRLRNGFRTAVAGDVARLKDAVTGYKENTSRLECQKQLLLKQVCHTTHPGTKTSGGICVKHLCFDCDVSNHFQPLVPLWAASRP